MAHRKKYIRSTFMALRIFCFTPPKNSLESYCPKNYIYFRENY